MESGGEFGRGSKLVEAHMLPHGPSGFNLEHRLKHASFIKVAYQFCQLCIAGGSPSRVRFYQDGCQPSNSSVYPFPRVETEKIKFHGSLVPPSMQCSVLCVPSDTAVRQEVRSRCIWYIAQLQSVHLLAAYRMIDNKTPETEKASGPPPYEKDGYGYGGSNSRPMMVASSSTQSSLPRRPDISLPSGSFNRVSLQTRFADITGTYYVDPQNLMSEIKGRRKKRKFKQIPDAVFRSRRGNLSLDLATNGHINDVPKASIIASTRSGNISLNLISGAVTRPRFDLEVNTRSGTIILFVPNTFSGAIQLHTKTGDLNFLPGIASKMQVVKSTDNEYLVLVGKQHPPGSQPGPADFCRLRTRTGNIIVGERGQDTYVKTTTIWQKLTGFLRG
ncbi:hypothetical protein B0H19DRAFT_510867 [Mycena capillaripes]|nr:hypothetical protein B0H19DRAFT_510867 [Mycena capillaripes]